MRLLSDAELRALAPAETAAFPGPVPTQSVSSDEFMPAPQTAKQRRLEARIKELGGELARRQGLTRRQFLASASGMAAAFLAMNEVYGSLYDVSPAEAATPEMAVERAQSLAQQFIMDCHTHFLRDDTRIMTFVRQRQAVGKAGWNPALVGKEQTIEDLKFANYYKEIFLDSDTKVALISGSPSDVPAGLVPHQRDEGGGAGAGEQGRRLPPHAEPRHLHAGAAGLARVDRPGDRRPQTRLVQGLHDRRQHQQGQLGKYPWRMDDEKVAYKGYEKFQKAGLVNVCVHKGLFPPSVEQQFPHLLAYSDVRDVGKAAKDWPQLNFVIYHSAYRFAGGGKVEDAWDQFEKTGRIEWVTDFAEIPAKYGVTNVYADLGQIFAQSTVADPRVCAAMLGQLIRGLGADHVVWGTDAIWTGSPQWQIEAMRRLEIPEDMQKKYGFQPLGPADGQVKTAIFGENNARIYKYEQKPRAALATDRIARLREEYEKGGGTRSNLRYGYVVPSRA